jgi:DNA-binding transcriptional LysR family regulator
VRGSDFAGLSAFVTVAERNSFTKAAKELGLSTATLSQSIKGLEERLGVRLLNRTTRSVGVTVVGERLLSRLKPALADYNAAIEGLNDFRERPCGLLRVTVPPPAIDLIFTPALSRFLKAYPEIRVEVSSDPALTDIVAERFDAGIRSGRRIERDMIAVRISKDLKYAVAASPSYLDARGTPAKPQDLRDHKCIRFRFATGELLPWRFSRKGGTYEVAVEATATINDERLAAQLAVDGAGILYHAELYLGPLVRQGKLVSLFENALPAGDALYLYYPSRRQNPAALQALIDFLKAEYKSRDGGA